MASGNFDKDTVMLRPDQVGFQDEDQYNSHIAQANRAMSAQAPPYTATSTANGGYNYGYYGTAAVGGGQQHVVDMPPRVNSAYIPEQMTIVSPEIGLEPQTTCALVMSTLSAIFCLLWCGTLGILVAWQARLQVLDKKWAQARHSLNIVWILFGISLLFGVVVWGVGIWAIVLVATPRTYVYSNGGYGNGNGGYGN